ncbi:MAG: ATP-binding cassette domain-containing protein [Actinobacteria bacterium]|nr:ATP-binding cassette domain-containing protein [Actinomycetota bacterium]
MTAIRPETNVAYRLADLSRTYGDGNRKVHALREASFSVRSGEYVAVVGSSGSGKSTLLQLLGGLDRPSSGTIEFFGEALTAMSERQLTNLRQRSIGFIFQQFNLIPTLTALQNVEAALAGAAPSGHDAARRARLLLASVGLEERARHLPGKLSGGEQQRVAIARALANEPRVLLADEPTGNLDSETGRDVISVLRSLAEVHGQTVIVVTHDPRIAAGAPRLMHMDDGRVAESNEVLSDGLGVSMG